MKKIFRYLALVIATAVSSVAIGVGCAKDGDDLSSVIIWTIDAGKKVMKDNVALYENERAACSVDVVMAKNEYEAGRVVITAMEAVSAYDVVVNDLTAADGTSFESENIAVYNEKYQKLNAVGNEYYTEVGYYPDALLPFDKAKEYGENKIAANNNQSLYLVFHTPMEQKSGEYKGNFGIKIGGEVKNIPVKLTVYDASNAIIL